MTEPENSSDTEDSAPDLQQRDLLLALVTLTQELGHLPSPDEINEHGEYRHQQYREEFDDLFNAYQVAGILSDSVTRKEFHSVDKLQSQTEGEPKSEEESGLISEAEQQRESPTSGNSAKDTPDSEPVTTDVAEIDVERPDFPVPENFSEADLIEEIRRFAGIIDEPPTENVVNAYGRFPINAFYEAFGSWEESLEAAGYDPSDLPDRGLRKYTNVEVLDGIRAVADELGRPPTTTEVGESVEFSGGLGSVRFGSWGTALEVAGLDPSERSSVGSKNDDNSQKETTEEFQQPPSIKSQRGQADRSTTGSSGKDISGEDLQSNHTKASRQSLLEEIKRIDESLERIPYASDMDREGEFTAHTYRDRFGGWDEALEAAGIDKEAALLEDMQRVADKVDGNLTQTAMNKHGKYSHSMAARYFGSWSDARERFNQWELSKDEKETPKLESPENDSLGVDVNRQEFVPPEDVDESDLIAEIQRFAEVIDEPPTSELVVAYGRYPGDEYVNTFDSWDEALRMADLDPEDTPDWSVRSHTNVDILDELRDVIHELGHEPNLEEIARRTSFLPGLPAVRFGSLSDALEIAGLDQSGESSVQVPNPDDRADNGGADENILSDEDDPDAGEEDDSIGSMIDSTLEELMSSGDDEGPV